VADLGPVADLHELTKSLVIASSTGSSDAAAASLYHKLFAPFDSKLAAATSVYLAPDGILDLVPFSRLKLADGRYWEERQEVHLLQTSRDLLRTGPDKPDRGLLALGGIDFGVAASAGAKPDSGVLAAAGGQGLSGAITRAAATFRDGFPPLPASGEEGTQVKEWYEAARRDEPADAWFGSTASKKRLMELKSPPRVLHLATHGFYRPAEQREPMLTSGVASRVPTARLPERVMTASCSPSKRKGSTSKAPNWLCCPPATRRRAPLIIRRASMAWYERSKSPAPAM